MRTKFSPKRTFLYRFESGKDVAVLRVDAASPDAALKIAKGLANRRAMGLFYFLHSLN